jgi:ketosteroid isomerase-like protein
VGALALAALRLRRDTARAMSQENLEIVRRSFEAFQRGGPDAMLDLFSDDVITYRADPDGATFDGKAGFRDAAADWTEDFSEWQVLPQEFTDLGERSWFGSSR